MYSSIPRIGLASLGLSLGLTLASCGGGGGTSSAPGAVPPPSPTPTQQVVDLANQPPTVGALAILLTDGSVLIQGDPSSNVAVAGSVGASLFFRLTPDAKGDYQAGTWTQIAPPPAGYAPYAGASAVLADGRVLFVGGEYNQNNYNIPFAPSALTNMSAVYDPQSNSWTMIAPPPGLPYIGDVPSVILPDGRFVFGTKLDNKMWSLDPTSLTWLQISSTGKADNFSEEGLTLLPNGNLLTIDMVNTPHAEHYVPALGQWIADGITPVALTSPTDLPSGIAYGPAPVQTVGGVTYGPGPAGTYFPPGEIGPAILRPDGTVFATGAATSGQIAHTAIYTPGALATDVGIWTRGPDFPNGDDAGDSSAALLPNGNVLVAGESGALYEFDGSRLTTTVAKPSAGGSNYVLPLPSGQTLVLALQTKVRLYIPTGAPNPAWAPTIRSAPAVATRGGTFTVSGTQFNGLSQAAAYGDELNSSTNFPIVRIANSASGHVFYARTHNHSTMGVATGSTVVTTQFDVPLTAEIGASTLVVVANGIASAPVMLSVN